MNKLELGCGDRPTPGYLHQDITELTDLDFHCQPWEIDLEEQSLNEIIAFGVMEHLSFKDFKRTIDHMRFLLQRGGLFLFDVPDIHVWSEYLYNVLRGKATPFSKEHIYNTFMGWQRWPGDEHRSMWTRDDINRIMEGFVYCFDSKAFKERATRNRFHRPEDAHLYINAIKK